MSTLPDIYNSESVGNKLMLFSIVALAFFIYCAWFIYQHHLDADRTTSLILGSIWVVGSPTWFFIEHFFIFKYYGNSDQYEQFKRAQELASRIWVGGIFVLAAIWSGGFPK